LVCLFFSSLTFVSGSDSETVAPEVPGIVLEYLNQDLGIPVSNVVVTVSGDAPQEADDGVCRSKRGEGPGRSH
jgi:hypothetical protein